MYCITGFVNIRLLKKRVSHSYSGQSTQTQPMKFGDVLLLRVKEILQNTIKHVHLFSTPARDGHQPRSLCMRNPEHTLIHTLPTSRSKEHNQHGDDDPDSIWSSGNPIDDVLKYIYLMDWRTKKSSASVTPSAGARTWAHSWPTFGYCRIRCPECRVVSNWTAFLSRSAPS